MQEELNSKIYLQEKNDFKNAFEDEYYDYSRFSQLKDFDFDRELIAKFTPIARKLNLSQESVEMLLEIALEMSQKQNAIFEQSDSEKLSKKVAEYSRLLKEDKEFSNQNSSGFVEYMRIANLGYTDFISQELRDILKEAGLNFHPEVIKMFHKIGELIAEDSISLEGAPPCIQDLTPAQLLYGVKN